MTSSDSTAVSLSTPAKNPMTSSSLASSSSISSQSTVRALLADRAVLRQLRGSVGRRVPEHDIDDVLHNAACEALASSGAPDDPAACRLWLHGLVRHQVADFHLAQQRERARYEPIASRPADSDDDDSDEPAATPAPLSARDRLGWVAQQLEKGELEAERLDWLVRSAEGESLEALGESLGRTANQMYKRVHATRRKLRAGWARDSTPPPWPSPVESEQATTQSA